MQRSLVTFRIVKVLVCLLVCKATLFVLLSFGDYFPPNFRSDFLLGREAYFFGPYRWAFYAHILSGPFTLLNGLFLLNDSIRSRFTKWHKILGRAQVVCALFLVAPSGLWMAWYSATGAVAAAGFATLAVATAVCAAKGWQSAMQRRLKQHQCWMHRCYTLLCSAVVLRVLGGLSEVLGAEWTYPYTAWVSWVLPLVVLELVRFTMQSSHHQQSSSTHVEFLGRNRH